MNTLILHTRRVKRPGRGAEGATRVERSGALCGDKLVFQSEKTYSQENVELETGASVFQNERMSFRHLFLAYRSARAPRQVASRQDQVVVRKHQKVQCRTHLHHFESGHFVFVTCAGAHFLSFLQRPSKLVLCSHYCVPYPS